ncbi:Intraflagellar transport protein 43 homolog A, partial [Geodia barretti]
PQTTKQAVYTRFTTVTWQPTTGNNNLGVRYLELTPLAITMSAELEETTLEERGVEGGPPKPRRVGGWGEEKGKRRRDTVEEDERLRVPESFDDDDDLPVIPDLEAVQKEDLTTQIAAPPSLTVNRLASYRELEADIQKQNFTLVCVYSTSFLVL